MMDTPGQGGEARQEADHPAGPGPSLLRVAAQGAAEDIGPGCRAVPSIGHLVWPPSVEGSLVKLPSRAMRSSA